jgi:transcriptional regulator with XRE-family HTH domain
LRITQDSRTSPHPYQPDHGQRQDKTPHITLEAAHVISEREVWMEQGTPGARVQSARKRRGLTQRELAEASGLSLPAVKKIGQGACGSMRLETVRGLAVALGVPTSALRGDEPDAPEPGQESVQRWEPVRRAIGGEFDGGEPAEEPTVEGLRSAFGSVTPLLLDGSLDATGNVIPGLLRDADTLVGIAGGQRRGEALTLRSWIRQVAGSLMLHVWEFDAAGRAFDLALADAQDLLTVASVTGERCWGLIRQGRLAETRELAFRRADEAEPRMSRASREELAAWGRLLVRGGAAAVRDNRPGEAGQALRLARMAALGARRDFVLSYSPWHVFGPSSVAITMAEHAVIQRQPEAVLEIDTRLGKSPAMRFAPSHRLDVAHAHAMLHHDAEAVAELQGLRMKRPEWLAHQRHAADILQMMIRRRRSLTADMRELADAADLPL